MRGLHHSQHLRYLHPTASLRLRPRVSYITCVGDHLSTSIIGFGHDTSSPTRSPTSSQTDLSSRAKVESVVFLRRRRPRVDLIRPGIGRQNETVHYPQAEQGKEQKVKYTKHLNNKKKKALDQVQRRKIPTRKCSSQECFLKTFKPSLRPWASPHLANRNALGVSQRSETSFDL